MSKISQELREKVVELSKEVPQLSISKIAKACNIGSIKVKTIFEEEDIPIIQKWCNSGPCPDTNTFLYMCDHNTQAEICNYFNLISNNVVQRWKAELGWQPANKQVSKEILNKLYHEDKLTLEEISYKFNVSDHTIGDYIKKYNIPIHEKSDAMKLCKSKVMTTKNERYGDPYYIGINNRSKAELEIEEFLNSYGLEFFHTRNVLPSNKELDGYSYKINKAFEYCGLYWHTEEMIENRKNCNGLGKTFHYLKYKECAEQGIELFTIFEHEWKYKKEKIKSFLKAKCGIFDQRFYARKCNVGFIPTQLNKQFFDISHIQGFPRQITHTVGLFYENDFVGGMSFGKHHRNSKETVLNRLAFKPGIQIVGGAQKMFKFFIDNIDVDHIVTWSDNRFTSGDLYGKLGFELETEYGPDYFYVGKNLDVKSKQSMKKSNTGCPPDITEREFCKVLGWERIWDCGKKKWLWKRDK